MAFHIRSKYGSPLTSTREQQQFERALPSGVYEGMQVHHGTTGLRVSLIGGTFCINGVVIYDDADTTDIFELTAGQNHIIYVTYDGENVEVHLKSSADLTTVPAMTPLEVSMGIMLALISIGPGQTDLSNALFINYPVIPKYPDRHINMTVAKCTSRTIGSVTTVHFEDMFLTCVSGEHLNSMKIEGGSSLIYPNGYSVSSDTGGAPGARILLFVIDPKGFKDDPRSLNIESVNVDHGGAIGSTAAQMKAIMGGMDSSFTGEDHYPYRMDHENVFLIGVVDVDAGYLSLANGILMPLGNPEFDSGKYSHLAEALSSTAYGTGPVYSTGGVIDVDDVIVNAATLRTAGLQEAYDSFELGSADGAGKEVDITAGAITLNNDLTNEADRWDAALRIVLDSESDGRAGEAANGLPGQERGIDVENRHGDDRNALTYRRLVSQGTCTITYSSGRVRFSWGGQPHNLLGTSDLAVLQSHWVTFDGFAGGDAANKRYRLEVEFVPLDGSYGYIRTVEGDANIHTAAPSDFNFSFDGQSISSVPYQLWETPAVLSENSMLKNLAVAGDVHGYGGADDPALGLMLQRPFPTLKSFIDTTAIKAGGAPTNGCFSAPVLGSPGYSASYAIPFGSGRIDTDGRWLFSELPTQVDGSRGVRIQESSITPVPRDVLSAPNASGGPVFTSNEDVMIMIVQPSSGAPRYYQAKLKPTGQDDLFDFALPSGRFPNVWLEDPVAAVLVGNLLYVSCINGGGGTYLRAFDMSGVSAAFEADTSGAPNTAHNGSYIAAFRRHIAMLTYDGSNNIYINYFPNGDLDKRRGLQIGDASGGVEYGLYMSAHGIFVLYSTSGGDFKIAQYSLDRLAHIKTVELPWHPESIAFTGSPSMSGAFGDIFVAYKMTSSSGTLDLIARFEESNLGSTEAYPDTLVMPSATSITTDGLMVYCKGDGDIWSQPIGNPDAVWTRVTNNFTQDTAFKRKYHRIMATPSWYK